jgi:MFS family permease
MSTQATSSSAAESGGTWSALFSEAHRAIAIIIAVGIALHSANVYLASAVMPSIAVDLGGLSMYAWATTVFVLAAVLGSTSAATVLGRSGTRSAYRAAILLVGAGTIVCAVAPSMPVLLVGRFLQGLGGGLLFALAYSMVRIVLPERLWPVTMGLISAMWGLGTFSGPALGGTFAEIEQWRLAFWVIVPVTVFFALWGGARLPRDAGREERPPAAPLASVALLGLAVLVVLAASVSTSSSVNLVGLAVGGVLLVAWLAHERRTGGLLPSTTFGADGRLRWLYVAMAMLTVTATPEIFVAYFGQRLQGLGPLAAGYLATAIAAGWTTASLLLSDVDARRRRRYVTVAPLVVFAGLALLAVVGPMESGALVVVGGIALGFVLLGWGIGMAWPHLITGVLQVVPAEQQGLAGASVTTIQLATAAVAAAVGATIVNLAGFSEPGVVGAHDAAQWLYLAMLPVPALIGIAYWRGARRAIAPPADAPDLSPAVAVAAAS